MGVAYEVTRNMMSIKERTLSLKSVYLGVEYALNGELRFQKTLPCVELDVTQ